MNSKSILNTSYETLESLVNQYRQALDGIPENDLNSWKPAAEHNGGGAMNTFAAMCVHVVAAARWRTEEQLYDQKYARDRESEFSATASAAEIEEQFSTLLRNFRNLIDSDASINLDSLPTTIRDDHPHWTKFDWLISAIGHTALHLGHAQIHKQLWLAECGGNL